MSKKKIILVLFLPIIIFGSIMVGIVIGGILTPNDGSSKGLIFPQNQQFTASAKINDIITFISEMYVDSVNKKELTEKSIASMLAELDPHSYYIPARDFDGLNDPIEGNFEGIGIEFRVQNDTVIIISPIANGPSEKLGIKAGDRIIMVDSITVAGIGITNDSIIKLLKGPKGSIVEVDIKRNGYKKRFHYKITRDKIPLFSVESPYIIKEDIGYLKITRFSKTTHQEFIEAVHQLLKGGMKKLIIDLRNNGGGLLSSATQIADEVLPKGKMIVYTDGRTRNKQKIYATDKGDLIDIELAVLINENAASASEILAGAIQDNDRGVIVGRRSFGKGLVQEQIVWPDGSALRLTVARYYTPTGRCIQKPYGDNLKEYLSESFMRHENGEMLSADSIHLPDSLKYYTPMGKVVYGGGGIMPDIFVPIDTSKSTNYLYELRYRGIIQNFALYYADKNRALLKGKYQSAFGFKQKFIINNDLFNSLIKYAEENNVTRNLKEIAISKELIKRELKASISRNMFNDFGFYIVVNEFDTTVLKAIESF